MVVPLISRYSGPLPVLVFTDVLPPKAPFFGMVYGSQNTGVSKGQMQVTLNWVAPTENESIGGEFLETADGLEQEIEAIYDPIVSGKFAVYEMNGYGGGGYGDTTLAGSYTNGVVDITVVSISSFTVGDWIQLFNGVDGYEYFKIEAINGTIITLETPITRPGGFSFGMSVKEVHTATLKALTTDYTVDLPTAIFTLLAGRFTPGNHVVLAYTTTLQDLNFYELYRAPGNDPIPSGRFVDVVGYPYIVPVNTSIPAGSTQYIDTLTPTENGQTWTYYLFAADEEAAPNFSLGGIKMVETISTIPQNLRKSVSDNRVVLGWDEFSVGSDQNSNGWNIYRCFGSVFDPPAAQKLNSIVVTANSFDDSAFNLTNRVSGGTVPYPMNSNVYVYKVESVDSDTTWDVGTQNQSQGVAENLIAEKSPPS